ncbi:MAG TPA: discoidin domain-containing protein [Thermoanaerobaculia bacterium]
MKRLVFTVLLAAACAKRELPPPAVASSPPVDVTDAAERVSLLDMAHGATVVSRTGEALLEVSALHAIDGDPGSYWMSPPQDLPQSMVVALPARSRIEKVGIRTVGKGGFTVNHVTFEASLDGRAFSPMITIKSAATDEAQWFDVKPVDAAYLRVTMADSALPNQYVRMASILARGAELEPPHPGDINGCWALNGEPARFVRRGTQVVGVLQSGKEPMRFVGAFDGRIYRLSWIRGNDYGMTLMTVSPDGQHLSAMNWHEEAIPMFFDTSWFGERGKCSLQVPDPTEVALALLRRSGRYSLYGQTDVKAILKTLPTYRFVAHEFRLPTGKENHDAVERALAPLRELGGDAFIAQGGEAPRQEPVTESMRAMYSTVDLEIRR